MKTLSELEQNIHRTQIDYLEVSSSLQEIQSRGLYRKAGYHTFDMYLAGRWGWRKNYMKNVMKAAAVAKDVSSVVNSVPSVTQALFMKSLTTEQRQELAKKVGDFKSTPVTTIKLQVAKIRGAVQTPRKEEPEFAWGEKLIFTLEQTSLHTRDLIVRKLPYNYRDRLAPLQSALTTTKNDIVNLLAYLEGK
jgi:hypothetical protein